MFKRDIPLKEDAEATPGTLTTPTTPATPATHTALVAVFREEAGWLTSAMLRILGDFDVAEEIVQDALVVALERWPVRVYQSGVARGC